MSINQDKSKCMLFNRARKYDFEPELYLSPGNQLEQVEEMKLVGYKLRSDLRTISNKAKTISAELLELIFKNKLEEKGKTR